MTARGRSANQSHEWETYDDYNTSMYDPQYPDDDVGGGVHLDHCRLYITNVPKALSEEGLRTAFSKYGTLVESYLNKDPTKKYGLVRYETPGEAKLAIMKLNKTEPLKLNVVIAHKPKSTGRPKQDHREKQDRTNTNHTRDRGYNREECASIREDSASVSSRGQYSRKQEEVANGDDMEDEPEDDDFGYSELDPSLHLELENLKLEQLKIKEEQLMCKHRMILLRQADRKPVMNNTVSNRCILPDGKIVVRNVSERAPDADVSFGAGAGDSSAGSRACVSCGRPADAYCAGCGLTPYCGPRCQRRDWAERHRAVCHNLARLSGAKEPRDSMDTPAVIELVAPPTAPLRAPHVNQAGSAAPRREQRRDDDPDKLVRNGVAPNRREAKRDDERSQDSGSDQNAKRLPNNFNNNRGARPNNYNNNKNNNDGGNTMAARRPAADRLRQFNKQDSHESSKPEVTSPKSPIESQPAKPTLTFKPEPKPVPRAEPVAPKSEPVAPKPEPRQPPASVSDVTPARILVPKSYLVEHLNIGDAVLLSVDRKASECRSARGGYVCLSMHEKFETDYQLLCEDFVLACEADSGEYKPIPGESCSYFNPEDGSWYRARCLTPTILALLDMSKLIILQPTDKMRKLTAQYQSAPEFCCLLQANGVEIGANIKCSITSKTADGHKVTIEDVDSGASMGEGEVFRWIPTVDYVVTKPVIPEVCRPAVSTNSTVLLVDATSLQRAFVRAAHTRARLHYDDILQQVALSGQTAEPLKEPPVKGQTVLGKFADGLHYRALCQRTNARQNKYLLEYSEFGNVEIVPLEKIYPCPKEFDLSAVPSQVSLVKLSSASTELTAPALEYVEKIKESEYELVLTLAEGGQSAPSGALVNLKLVKNNDNVNRKLEDMCKPDWKKIEERAGDVVEIPQLGYSDLEFSSLPEGPCTLEVLDLSALEVGNMSGFLKGSHHAEHIFTNITKKMAEYCNSELGREPYLPRHEELCIAQFPPYPQWFRAVFVEVVGGAGGSEARVYYIDYGNDGLVPVTLLRKMMPEFVRGLPCVSSCLEIRDFPKNPSRAMLQRALQHMQVSAEGRGAVSVRRCELVEPGSYVIDAPELLAAMAAD